MKAILLAAGVGSRLGVLTAKTPKCLLPIAGRPLLDYWFDALKAAGVSQVLINLHHHADQVRAYLAGLPNDMQVVAAYEPSLLGSAGTIRAARDFIGSDTDFFVIYADNFAEIDLARLNRFHVDAGRPILTLVAYLTTEPQRCGILELDSAHRVIFFEEKPIHPKSRIANAGIHVAGAELFDYLPAQTPADLGFDVLPRLIGKMAGYVTDEFIQDIGTPAAYELVCRRLQQRN